MKYVPVHSDAEPEPGTRYDDLEAWAKACRQRFGKAPVLIEREPGVFFDHKGRPMVERR